MSAGQRSLVRHHVRAPREHAGTLIEPPLSVAGSRIAQNIAQQASATSSIAGVPLVQLIQQARREVVDAAWHATRQYRDVPAPEREGPLLLAGHQPQLFHAGVWFKNFVLAGLAKSHHGLGINLVIDSDTLRSPAIRVPGGSIGAPTAHAIAFDAPGAQIPFEERSILDRELFDSFGQRAAAEIAPLITDPLLRTFWPLVLRRGQSTDNLGACLAQGRHMLEGEWGIATLELPQSAVCQLPAFYRFAAHLLSEAVELREIYNRSLAEYRHVHRVRSKNHPAPDLACREEWIEAPFWIWSRAEPQRKRLFVRKRQKSLHVTDRAALELELPAEAEGLVEGLSKLNARGIKLRTRALITTLWARLAFSDLFLHGIGGAKYDQLTDLILTRFFRMPARAFLTVTATLRLPIDYPVVTQRDVQQIEQQMRDLQFHPERWLDAANLNDPERSEARELLNQKSRWIAMPQTRENARQRCRGIRAMNESLSRWTDAAHAKPREAEHEDAERLALRPPCSGQPRVCL